MCVGWLADIPPKSILNPPRTTRASAPVFDLSNVPESTESCRFEICSFVGCSNPFSFKNEPQRFSLLSNETECVPGPPDLISIRLGQPTNSGRIDNPLSFWAQWFSNRQVSSIFTPSLTSRWAVQRIWATNDLKSHRTRTFKLSNDPQFEAKFWDIIGLYLDPPTRAIVLCCDEKSQSQALERTQSGLFLDQRAGGHWYS